MNSGRATAARCSTASFAALHAVVRLGFKRRATAVLKSINSIPYGSSTPFETRLKGRVSMEMSELL